MSDGYGDALMASLGAGHENARCAKALREYSAQTPVSNPAGA
jgi:hypothetical protein